MKNIKADTDFLVGKKFTASSGNVATFKKLEDGAIQASWRKREVQTDRDECNRWVLKLLEREHPCAHLRVTINNDQRYQDATLAAWRKMVEGE